MSNMLSYYAHTYTHIYINIHLYVYLVTASGLLAKSLQIDWPDSILTESGLSFPGGGEGVGPVGTSLRKVSACLA